MKKRMSLSFYICLLLTVILLSGCENKQEADHAEAEKRIVVGFSQIGAESDWRNANTKSMTEALCEENGFRLIFDDAQNKQEKQITALRNFIQMDVDYIVLAPTKETGWETVLQEAYTAGIPVIIVDRMIQVSDDKLYTCWVGSNFLQEGRRACEWMESKFGEKEINIVHLQGNIGSSAQLGRTGSLDDALACHPDWHLVAREVGDFTQAKGQEIIEDLLSRNVSFDVIYSENDNMSFGAIEALYAAGLQPGKDVTIVSFDACRKALEMVMQGEISFVAECNPLHGPRVEKIIRTLEEGRNPERLTFVSETTFDSSLTTKELEERAY